MKRILLIALLALKGGMVSLVLVISTIGAARGEMWPPLDQFIAKCVLVVKARQIGEFRADEGAINTFEVVETWKGALDPKEFTLFTAKGLFQTTQGTHGARVSAGQEILFFFTRHNEVKGEVRSHSTAFPISNGKIVYAATSDFGLRAEYALEDFKRIVQASDEARKKDEDNVRETVFRHQFENNASAQKTNAKVYFLVIGDNAADPSDDFMKRFTEHKPPVRKSSASTDVLDRGVVDKTSGERGLRFRVTVIKWISDTEAEVKGGYHEGSESSSSNTYTLKKENGKWKVTKDIMNRIA